MENEALADQFMTLLPPDRQRALRSLGRPQRFRAGDTLLHTGQVGDRVMVIVAGIPLTEALNRHAFHSLLRRPEGRPIRRRQEALQCSTSTT